MCLSCCTQSRHLFILVTSVLLHITMCLAHSTQSRLLFIIVVCVQLLRLSRGTQRRHLFILVGSVPLLQLSRAAHSGHVFSCCFCAVATPHTLCLSRFRGAYTSSSFVLCRCYTSPLTTLSLFAEHILLCDVVLPHSKPASPDGASIFFF
jgi:hypothetical protein